MLELVTKCKAGDTRGFEQLVQHAQPWALRYALALLDDESLAQDAVQEAFITVFLKIQTLKHPEAFVPWLRCIIRTQCYRIMRGRRELLVGDSGFTGNPVDPADELAVDELRKIVGNAIAHLPQPGRETVDLFYLRERSIAEVARLLNIPQGTVKRRLYDARQRLKHLLANHAPGSAWEFEPTKPSRALTGKSITIL